MVGDIVQIVKKYDEVSGLLKTFAIFMIVFGSITIISFLVWGFNFEPAYVSSRAKYHTSLAASYIAIISLIMFAISSLLAIVFGVRRKILRRKYNEFLSTTKDADSHYGSQVKQSGTSLVIIAMVFFVFIVGFVLFELLRSLFK